MVLKVRSAEEIEAHLQKPQSVELIKLVGKQRKRGGEFAKEHKIALNRLMLKAFFGPKVFRGTQGRTLKAISELQPIKRKETTRQIGRKLLEAYHRSKWTTWHMDTKNLEDLPPDDSHRAMHSVQAALVYLGGRGQRLSKR